jgi:hypothetical protein
MMRTTPYRNPARQAAGATMARHPRRHRTSMRRCNLCADEFAQRSAFERYCDACRDGNELLRFSEWLPEIDAAIEEKLTA